MVGQAWNVPDHGLTCGHCGWTVEAFPGRPLLEEEPPPEFFLYLCFLLEPPAPPADVGEAATPGWAPPADVREAAMPGWAVRGSGAPDATDAPDVADAAPPEPCMWAKKAAA